jgi:hypothetical protein
LKLGEGNQKNTDVEEKERERRKSTGVRRKKKISSRSGSEISVEFFVRIYNN